MFIIWIGWQVRMHAHGGTLKTSEVVVVPSNRKPDTATVVLLRAPSGVFVSYTAT